MTCVSGLGQVRRGGHNSDIMHNTSVFRHRVCPQGLHVQTKHPEPPHTRVSLVSPMGMSGVTLRVSSTLSNCRREIDERVIRHHPYFSGPQRNTSQLQLLSLSLSLTLMTVVLGGGVRLFACLFSWSAKIGVTGFLLGDPKVDGIVFGTSIVGTCCTRRLPRG